MDSKTQTMFSYCFSQKQIQCFNVAQAGEECFHNYSVPSVTVQDKNKIILLTGGIRSQAANLDQSCITLI